MNSTHTPAVSRPTIMPKREDAWPRASLDAIAGGWLWPGLLIVLGGTISLFYTCTVPLVGFAAVAGTTIKRDRALLVCALVWLANQVWGYTLHDYPRTPDSFAWGLSMGVASLLVTGLALIVQSYGRRQSGGLYLWSGAAVLAGFALYEGVLGFAGLWLGGLEGFAPKVLWDVFVVNALWATGILIAHRLLVSLRRAF